MPQTRKGSKKEPKTQLEVDYEFLMQFARPSAPAPVQREDLAQPEPYPHVQTLTTYGIYELA
mgnify:CR=1 FL=1